MGKIFNHHGIKYERLKKWHLFNNDYRLLEDYVIKTDIIGFTVRSEFIELTKAGKLTLRTGFAWNGPSGPTIDTKNFMRGSLVHDAIYRLIRWKLVRWWVRDYGDVLLYQICMEDRMSKFRATYVLKGVHEGGIDSALPGGGGI